MPFRFSARKLQLGTLALAAVSTSATSVAQTSKAPDITKVPTLYVVPYAHLDTQWRWEFPQVISEYLLKTMRVNFDYIDKYPHYVFNWTGSNRYRLMKEYFPDDYARMKGYIAAGRWYPAGSSVEEGDVNLPSAEGLFRQVLYGNTYFRHDFGKASDEYMIPDCFGFPASLPTILHHAGVKGFSTQKLNAEWQPAPKVGGPDSPEKTPEGIPFNVGKWIGPDGSFVIAALNPGTYGGNTYTDISSVTEPRPAPQLPAAEVAKLTPQQLRIYNRLSQRERQEPNWVERIALDGKVSGIYADYHYVGTGDIGGATQESTVKLLEAIVTKSTTVLPTPPLPDFMKAAQPAPGQPVRVGQGPVTVIEATADQLFRDIPPSDTDRFPTVQGDLELINHSAGSLTSQAYHKRWVLMNERLADASEKASVAAAWMGGLPYPQERLTNAWTLALGGHFHDTAAGTATPLAYEYAWNDDVLTANQFAGIFTSATQSVAAALDTAGQGVPVVLYNNLNIDREDVVSMALPASLAGAKSIAARGPNGEQVPAQVSGNQVLFVARVPSVGYAVYHLIPNGKEKAKGELKVSANSLENARYRVQVNADGDVSSIFDKQLNFELLSAPVQLQLTTDTPKQWPAWNMDFDQVEAKPRTVVGGPAQIRIKEDGPVRVTLEISRAGEGGTYVQTVSLAAGSAGNRLEFANSIDWHGKAENLKVAFPLKSSNPNATYNEDVGVVTRPNAMERQFEVVSHKWIDLTDASGGFGATILTDDKNASDKPNDNTLRLTLLRTPGIAPHVGYSDQANQDWGHHEIRYGITGHRGDWRAGQTDWEGYRLNDPLRAFTTTSHTGRLGKQISLLKVNNPRVRVFALKKSEISDELVVRFVEMDGKPANDVRVTLPGAITAAREINAQELPLEGAPAVALNGGALTTSLKGFEPKTFAFKLGGAPVSVPAVASQPATLTYDTAIATNDDTPTPAGGFDGKGDAYPAEMLPERLSFHGVNFTLAQAATGTPDAVTAHGQTIALPSGSFDRVYVLAASSRGDQAASFKVGNLAANVTVEDWGGFLGQWDTRLWKPKGTPVDWASSAHHQPWPPKDLRAAERSEPSPENPGDYLGLREGFVKPAEVAWFASHHHTATGLNQPYAYSYLFAYTLELPPGATTLTLPNNPDIRIVAVSAAKTGPSVVPATPLFDTLKHTSVPTTSTNAQ
ncbi:glycoside hydrolase family 38 C-terminal domain-containing protein [Terriglobus aquaticus]|uniref:Glycoside hydrolase family 38 C-terminal domain-containing protein n=1 Tax=Terriglobus aquaticus TaxID=940139 RepID=A0ABW9KHH6_9BACT|nr:glycoside hydrolase family 38 C-terminal domain-containing protein [Terriglobus aquaticus]